MQRILGAVDRGSSGIVALAAPVGADSGTTLLRLVLTVIDVPGTRVRLLGFDVTDLAAAARRP